MRKNLLPTRKSKIALGKKKLYIVMILFCSNGFLWVPRRGSKFDIGIYYTFVDIFYVKLQRINMLFNVTVK